MSGSATRTIAIRLTADNAEPTRRALEQVGETGERALRRIDAASAAAQPALQGLAAASGGAVRAFATIGVGLGGVERVFAGAAGGAGAAATAIAALAAGTVAPVAPGVAVARAGDQGTESLARLQAAIGSIAAAEAAYQGFYRLSQQTGVAVSESAGAFARFALAAREVGATNDQVLALVRTVHQAGIVAGASTAEITSTVMRLGQALDSGKLQGDELRSILENMPTLAKALGRQLGVGVGELRRMGEEGKLTADVVMPALLRAGKRINAEFEKLPPTMGRSFSILGEAITRFAAGLDRALGLSQAIARAAQAAAAAVDRTRVAVHLGTPEETARAGQQAAQARLSELDLKIATLEQILGYRTQQSTDTTGTLALNAATSSMRSFQATFGSSARRVLYCISWAAGFEIGHGQFDWRQPGRADPPRESRRSAAINRGAVLQGFRLLRTAALQTRILTPTGKSRHSGGFRVVHGRRTSLASV